MYKKILLGVLAVFLMFSVSACAKPKEYYPSVSGKNLLSGGFVKWQGRQYYNAENQAVYFNMSASGFEVEFEGTYLNAILLGDWSNEVVGQGDQNPYINVFVDGETHPTKAEKIEIYMKEPTEYTLAKNLGGGKHSVKVFKCTETSSNKLALQSLVTDGKILDAPARGKLNIEFYGDSVTCGYGISATNQTSFSTDTEEALQTYAYLCARMLSADFTYMAASGYGMAHGLGANSSIAKWFGYADVNTDEKWDNAKNKVDIVVINLGANDNQYIIGNVDGVTSPYKKKERLENYLLTYKNFILNAIKVYGRDTPIFCCFGMMRETNLYTEIENLVYDEFQDKGYPNVYPIKLSEGVKNPLALHGHPGTKTNIESADILLNAIEENTKFKRTTDNI